MEPIRELYDEYFAGPMSSIVFQEMRESRSLAYSAWAGMTAPAKAGRPYLYRTQIATQNDKLLDAIAAFDEIINDMPRSQAAYDIALGGLEARLRTERCINDDIAFKYLDAKDYGYDHDSNADLFKALGTTKLDDLVEYQKKHVAGRKYRYGILANPENIDIKALEKLGKVVILTTEDIFGY